MQLNKIKFDKKPTLIDFGNDYNPFCVCDSSEKKLIIQYAGFIVQTYIHYK